MQRQTVLGENAFPMNSWAHVDIFNRDGFSCNAIWGLQSHAHSTEVSWLSGCSFYAQTRFPNVLPIHLLFVKCFKTV